jgi:Uma2 family endonuclease
MALATEQKTIVYPSGDGEPVAESYAHMYVMFVTLEVLRQYLAGQQATVLANQFLYYAQGFPKLRVAPDVMVILQVPPGGRDSYKIWEEGQVPQVIFEMTSAQTQRQDQEYKKDLYQALGVQEYWLFDPKGRMDYPAVIGLSFGGRKLCSHSRQYQPGVGVAFGTGRATDSLLSPG